MTREWGNITPAVIQGEQGEVQIPKRMALDHAVGEFLRSNTDVEQFTVEIRKIHDIFKGDEWATLITFEE